MRKREARREEPLDVERKWQLDVPSDPINEQACLAGAMLGWPETFDEVARVATKPEAFYAKPHRAIYEGLQELRRQRLEFDPAALIRVAPEVDVRIVEGLLASRPDVPANFDWHLKNLAWDWQRAQLARGALGSLLEALQDSKAAPEKVLALMRAVGSAGTRGASATPFLRDTEAVIEEMLDGLKKRVENGAHFDFGIPGLDFDEKNRRRFRPGAAPGAITMVTGMSGSGKSTFVGHLIIGLARQRRRVLVGAWEIFAPMTMELLTTLSLKWDRSKILDGKSNKLVDAALTPEEFAIFEAQARKMAPYITFLDNPFRRERGSEARKNRNEDHLDILHDHIEAAGCDVVVLDLFDRCLIDRSPTDELEALYRLHAITEATRVHMIAVHQQLLKGESVRSDKKPSIENLKGSSAYVDIASLILAPHIPAKWKEVPNNTFEVYNLKQRWDRDPFGIEFDWDPGTGQIWGGRDVAYDSAPERFGGAGGSGAAGGSKVRGMRTRSS